MRTRKRHVTLVWLLLGGATAVSWWLAVRGSADDRPAHQEMTTLLFVVAFFKVYLVMFEFMEVRDAPLALRRLSLAWIVLVCGAMLSIYYGMSATR